jgi:alpha-amylase
LPIAYSILNKSDRPLVTRFGVENNFALLSGHHVDGFYRIPGHELAQEDTFLDSVGELKDVGSVELGHRWFGLSVYWEWDQPTTLWRAPVNTVSNSEAGFERVYQASSVMPLWALNLPSGQTWTLKMNLSLRQAGN